LRQRQAHALERDQRVGQLVLHGLEAADGLAELAPFLGVVDRQLEGAARGAVRARQQQQAQQLPQPRRSASGRSGSRRTVALCSRTSAPAGTPSAPARAPARTCTPPAASGRPAPGRPAVASTSTWVADGPAVHEAQRAAGFARVELQHAGVVVGGQPGAGHGQAQGAAVQVLQQGGVSGIAAASGRAAG
jgi:hypothetical protein